MRSCIFIVVCLSAAAASNGVMGAPIFYSLNVQSNGDDDLVRVDAATGHVVTVGSLGPTVELDFPSLAIANGRLFVVHSTSAFGPVELLELDPASGAILSSVEITSGGNTVPIVEGFDSYGGDLFASYGLTAGGAAGTRSNIVGKLALDGSISDSITFSASDDFDGMAVDSNGQFFTSDASSPNVGSDIRTLTFTPPTASLLATIGMVDTDIVDLAFTDTGWLFGLDVVGGAARRIHQIDPTSGLSLSTVTTDSSWSLRGLVFASQIDAVPEPATATLLALAAGGYCIFLLLRRKTVAKRTAT